MVDQIKKNNKNDEKSNTVYNEDFQWPKKIKKVSKFWVQPINFNCIRMYFHPQRQHI